MRMIAILFACLIGLIPSHEAAGAQTPGEDQDDPTSVATTSADANHPPVAVVNGDASGTVLRLFARPGQQVALSAAGSSDPDGDALTYRWIRHDAADTYVGAVAISGAGQRDATVTIPSNAAGRNIHIALDVEDQPQDDRPALTTHRRVILVVRDQLTIMCLGDSITDGSHRGAYPGAYRIRLWERLQQAGWPVDLVGSKSNGPAHIDRHHEGYIGYRIDELTGDADGSEPDVALAAKLDAYAPDVVLLLIGTNDAIQNHAISQADQRYLELLQLIHDRRPDGLVVFATLPPIGDHARNERAVAINDQLPLVEVAAYQVGQWAQLVDLHHRLTTADLADGVHPTAAGYAKIGDTFFAALAAARAQGAQAPSPTNQAPSVALTAPSTGATFTAPALIAISANASDSEGSIAKVEFFAGSTKIGEDTSAPYGITWGNAAVGSYNLTAKAIDNQGATKTSTAVAITVTAPPTSGDDLISGLATKFQKATLAVGSAVFTDRSFTVSSVGIYGGAQQIRTPNNDKGNSASSGYLVFTATAAAEVLVAYDSRASGLPTWLGSFTATGETLTTTDVSFRLYRRQVAAGGSVNLGGNLASGAVGAGSNYWVIVRSSGGTTPTPAPVAEPIAINFQPASAPTVAGYLVDSGQTYASRNGQAYGWNKVNDTTRDRNAVSDQRVDTLIHAQKASGLAWELAVPNGTYEVTLVCGDPSFTDQINAFVIEGLVVTDPDGMGNTDTLTASVTIADGRLTITPAAGARNAKIQYVEVVPMEAGPG